ncbi:ferrous iron transporter B [Swaminathania salitolerans]|uniref:Ferrous iron transport protein B n=1 Tax=Swaminathania salitolerans TaxID=182838 RepID=A0A511BMV9_9PROT|nr:ferrous iron transporter B [Swaminathania salitolerans]GBQ10170.1 ferrous iron transport protein B [Swaminathania salitolerans LMG 21291]GEL01193.1 ferrous iron transporter B [Swaminathania salitolerans]
MDAVVSPDPATKPLRAALVGNPNCGKTSLFNQLTGSRQKVANYAGVTVERKEGALTTPGGRKIRLLDLPGAYSLSATSPDEDVTRDVCTGRHAVEPRPDLIICVVSATNLALHLRFLLELCQIGRPIMVVLNMMDEAERIGLTIDVPGLASALGLPVVPAISLRRSGVTHLLEALDRPDPPPPAPIPEGADLHAEVAALIGRYTNALSLRGDRLADRLDRWFLHPVWGPVILLVVLFFMFQTVFAWAQPVMDALEAGITALGEILLSPLPQGLLRSLLADGVIAGAGTVIVFLPQILILFLWILALEESGYLPRAAFLLDRIMALAGLSGRSFIPLLSSFACAIPGIMAARTIQNPRDRLVTILIAPLMTCSARLPVYTLLIAAFVPHRTVGGIFGLQGLVLFALYFVAIVSGIVAARLMTRGVTSDEHPLLLELPPYRRPNLRSLALGLWQRAVMFLSRVGTIIVSLNVLLWALSSFPAPPAGATGSAIDYSLAGMIGHWMLPVFAPVGFNWQICVSLIPGLAAREVAVSALATVYALGATEDSAATQLTPLLSAHWSMATAFALLAWYVYAPQCISTLAVMRRETRSLKVVIGAAAYLFGLAYAAAFLTYHATLALTG